MRDHINYDIVYCTDVNRRYREMAKKVEKRGPGRPSTTDYMVLIRLQHDDVRRLDAWIARRKKETAAKIGRGAAVRSIVRMVLGSDGQK